jgi:hypothetical protein
VTVDGPPVGGAAEPMSSDTTYAYFTVVAGATPGPTPTECQAWSVEVQAASGGVQGSRTAEFELCPG